MSLNKFNTSYVLRNTFYWFCCQCLLVIQSLQQLSLNCWWKCTRKLAYICNASFWKNNKNQALSYHQNVKNSWNVTLANSNPVIFWNYWYDIFSRFFFNSGLTQYKNNFLISRNFSNLYHRTFQLNERVVWKMKR